MSSVVLELKYFGRLILFMWAQNSQTIGVCSMLLTVQDRGIVDMEHK